MTIAEADVVRYTAVSAFVFLRLFAPAILNPKLFGLRPEYAVGHHDNVVSDIISQFYTE